MLSQSHDKIIDVLTQNKIPYYVTMGSAVREYTGQRECSDIDIAIRLSDFPKVESLLKTHKEEAIKQNKAFPHIVVQDVEFAAFSRFREEKVDFSPENKELYNRALNKKDRFGLNLIAKEDLIVKKLFFGREKDYSDIINLLFGSSKGEPLNYFTLFSIIKAFPAKSTLFTHLPLLGKYAFSLSVSRLLRYKPL